MGMTRLSLAIWEEGEGERRNMREQQGTACGRPKGMQRVFATKMSGLYREGWLGEG